MWKIFLIDDDDVNQHVSLRTIQSCLSDTAVSVQEFSSGAQALQYLEQHARDADKLPDLIFLDINMPAISGWDFLEKFENMSSSMVEVPKISMMSASWFVEDMNRALRYTHVIDYISKPLTQEPFEDLINELSKKRSQ